MGNSVMGCCSAINPARRISKFYNQTCSEFLTYKHLLLLKFYIKKIYHNYNIELIEEEIDKSSDFIPG